ncbi:hypothetical protein H5410_021741 [Solanum commersonii]|uniref:Uncharacterized protein n=1 Tax=Solanum commersonii TaxID=4109 RepID=A0A9J5ZG49_SOLCO|nr:hypothetical protein H5410_021741 [Solanum commersonii]
MSPRKEISVANYLQEQYEDLAAHQIYLRSVMEEKYLELKADMDKRQAEVMRIVNALKDSVDGFHLHHQARGNASEFLLFVLTATLGGMF